MCIRDSIYPADEYYLYAKEWADYHQWGFHRGTTTRNADNYCASQIYLDLYNICPDPEKIRKTKANMDMLVNTPQVNDWWWIDAIQMGMPIFAKMGKLTGEQKYFDKMWDMYEYTRNQHGENGMFNPKDGLWWRDPVSYTHLPLLPIFLLMVEKHSRLHFLQKRVQRLILNEFMPTCLS